MEYYRNEPPIITCNIYFSIHNITPKRSLSPLRECRSLVAYKVTKSNTSIAKQSRLRWLSSVWC